MFQKPAKVRRPAVSRHLQVAMREEDGIVENGQDISGEGGKILDTPRFESPGILRVKEGEGLDCFILTADSGKPALLRRMPDESKALMKIPGPLQNKYRQMIAGMVNLGFYFSTTHPQKGAGVIWEWDPESRSPFYVGHVNLSLGCAHVNITDGLDGSAYRSVALLSQFLDGLGLRPFNHKFCSTLLSEI